MNRKTLRRVGATAVLGAMAATTTQAAMAAGTTTVVVDQASFSTTPYNPGTGWGNAQDPERPFGFTSLAAGPGTPVRGKGSLRLQNTATDQLTTVSSRALSGTALSAITGAKYATFVDLDSQPGPVHPSLKIAVAGEGTTLVYEPYLVNNSEAMQRDVWKTWTPIAAGPAPSAGWWSTANASPCTPANSCSYSEIVGHFPGATVGDVKLAVGSSLSAFEGYVDFLDITLGSNTLAYNFESNRVNADTVTRIDESNTGPWSVEGSTGTDPAGEFSVKYVKGPNFPGLGGAGSARLDHTGPGSYSALIQDYFNEGDPTQRYLADLDNVAVQAYTLTEATKSEHPGLRFEVRLPDPQTQFAFATLAYSGASPAKGSLALTNSMHGATSADIREWQVTRPIAGLLTGVDYTWSELMRTDLRDAVILKALLISGSGTGAGTYLGGVDWARFEFRDGSSQTWNFEKAGAFAGPPTTTPLPGDRTPPVVSISTANNSLYLPLEELVIEGSATDAGSGVAKVGVYFTDLLGRQVGAGFVCEDCAGAPGQPVTFEYTPETALLPGVYKAYAFAKDAAGNGKTSTPVQVVVTV